MAGLNVSVSNSQAIATTTSRRALLQYTAPASGGGRLQNARVSFEGISPTGPKVLVEVTKASTGGTAVGTVTPVKVSGHTGSVLGTAKEDFSASPTGGTVIHAESVHPQGSTLITFSPNDVLNPGETVTIWGTTTTSVGSRSTIRVEE